MKGIADTGFLVAFANRRDRYFPWAYALASRVREPLLTCEAVLAESAHHLGSSALVLRMLETGLIEVAFDIRSHMGKLGELAAKYADHQPDLADLCLICMSSLYPAHPVITVDAEFLIYRRERRGVIPVVMPPGVGTKRKR